MPQHAIYSMMSRKSFSTEAGTITGNSTGDTESLWKIEKLRSETVKQHNVSSGFSCAKGFLLERKPQDAANIIQLLNQTSPDSKKSAIMDKLEKLVNKWPFEVIKHQKEDRKALAASLKADIPAMVVY
ncbi:hypothetical protein SLEP1_g203 [Rubroshorea leprosula]|uniref:Uncharacterized protein n=1 Tax=Rubroshorea leprosula TaxID=152421 RepID=A0AAV5H9J1_9ROSI|nr:hypothetical protein SLEP1_g203 [Rubroshorea leprosula]